ATGALGKVAVGAAPLAGGVVAMGGAGSLRLLFGAGATGALQTWRLRSDGALIPAGAPLALDAVPSALALHPRARFLYAALAGASENLAGFAFAADGALKPLAGPSATGGDTPTSLVFESSGRFLYAANAAAGSIAAFSVDARSGALFPVRGSPFAAPEVRA